jgi:hypothetical protein
VSSGRVYEQVTPVFKGGYGVREIDDVQVDGESLIYASKGVFAGSSSTSPYHYYQADRGESEWSSVALNPPAALSPYSGAPAFSPTLESSLWDLRTHEKNVELANGIATEEQFYLRSGGEFSPVGPPLKALDEQPLAYTEPGVSDDLCHVILEPVKQALLPQAVGAVAQLYDIDTCGAAPVVRMVTVADDGGVLAPDCAPTLGDGESSQNAISADGDVVYFEVNVPNDFGCEGQHTTQLFVRVGGDKTLEVSKPLEEACSEVPCPGAETRSPAVFRGASADGSKVFFMTAAQLVPATDKDNTNNLYEATIGCPPPAMSCEAGQDVVTSLVQVSHDAADSSEAANVQGVVAVSHDGSHVYFVASGVLSGAGPTVEGTQSLPVHGADNLYVYEHDQQYPQGRVLFVGDICSGPGESGEVSDLRCPGDLGKEEGGTPRNDTVLIGSKPPAQLAGAGEGILVFSTYAQLIDSGPEADTDDAQDIYRFDAETGDIQRVSIGENGYHANGNQNDVERVGIGQSGGFENMYNGDARIQAPIVKLTLDEERKLVRTAADESGSRIVFTTAASLSPKASNGQTNIYEWHEGKVSLISSGSSPEGDELPVITPSGRDVFFISSQGLVPQDTDGAPDVYDARIEGGFPPPPTAPAQCSGDACQGPLTNPAPLLVPGSMVQVPGENLPPAKAAIKKKTKAKKKPKTKKKKNKPKGGKQSKQDRSLRVQTGGRGR